MKAKASITGTRALEDGYTLDMALVLAEFFFCGHFRRTPSRHRAYGPLHTIGRTDTFDASGYRVHVALVHGVGLDYEFLFVRKYARLFSIPAGGKGLGVDLELFEAHTTRLTELGYRPESSRTNLTQAIGRLLLHRGGPDIPAITAGDLFDMAEQIRSFGQRDDFAQLRAALYQKFPWQMTDGNAGERFARSIWRKSIGAGPAV